MLILNVLLIMVGLVYISTLAGAELPAHKSRQASSELESHSANRDSPRHGPERAQYGLIRENAVAASAFVDTLGMNAHFESPYYYDHFPMVRSLIGQLGVRHYRVSAAQILFPGAYLAELIDLHTSFGTMFDVLADLHTTPTQVVTAIEKLPTGSVDSVEGPNEADDPNQGRGYDPHFASDVPAYMRSLYSTIKNAPATSHVSVIGPSFAHYQSYAAIGNISNDVQDGNMHDYFAGFSPGTIGWGGGGYPFAPGRRYGSIGWNIDASRQATGSRPVSATETGYYTAAIHGGVPLDVQAKYVPRLYFEHFVHSVPRTYLYQLIGYDSATADGTLDIVSPSYVASPAFNALAGLAALLNDGRRIGVATTYSWALGGQTANVDHVLMHQAAGSMVLSLWIETPSFDPNANGGKGADINVPAQTVTVSVAQPVTHVDLWTFVPTTGKWSDIVGTLSNGTVTLRVSDSVSILVFR